MLMIPVLTSSVDVVSRRGVTSRGRSSILRLIIVQNSTQGKSVLPGDVVVVILQSTGGEFAAFWRFGRSWEISWCDKLTRDAHDQEYG